MRDFQSPARRPAAPVVERAAAAATVKWYNTTKGFGFLAVDGEGDAFIHATVVAAAGHQDLPDGSRVVVDLGHGAKGPQVVRLVAVDTTSAAAPRPAQPAAVPADTETVAGTVKWFNTTKGFGFIAPDAGGKDIFVHVSALKRSGLDALAEGERVSAEVRPGQKGPEAARVRPI